MFSTCSVPSGSRSPTTVTATADPSAAVTVVGLREPEGTEHVENTDDLEVEFWLEIPRDA